MSNVEELFARIVAESVDKREQGTRFERLVQWFLSNDPIMARTRQPRMAMG